MTTTVMAQETGRSATLQRLDRRHLVHPHQNRDRRERHVFVRGKGSTVWDVAGNEFLDMMAGGNWVVAVGHARPELAQAAADQLGRLEYFSCWREYSNEPAVRLATRLAELSPVGLDAVLFTGGGSEGTDSAIKLARRYHYERGDLERTWILGRHFGYHGTTLGSQAVSGFDDMAYGVGPVMPHVAKLTPPMLYRRDAYGDQDPTDVLVQELEDTIRRIGADRIAAMIGEPVMGGAGVIVPPADYWARVREVLRRHGILLIADEVITAFGRTGAWFASEPWDPDIIICAKGLTSGYAPLGAVVMRDEIARASTEGELMFFHGQTYSGHPLACSLALANLRILAEERLLDSAARIQGWFREGLAPLHDLPIVGDVRIHGAMVGVELVVDRATTEPMPFARMVGVIDELRTTHGVLARDYGPTLVAGPALVLDEAEAQRCATAFVDVLSRAGRP